MKRYLLEESRGDYDGMMIESQCIEEEAKKASKKMKKLSNYRNKINQFVKTLVFFSDFYRVIYK